jgi:acyl-CoA synthetase (NDP forming)
MMKENHLGENHYMKKFMEPESVAVVGASADPNKGGYFLVSNLKKKFQERLYPVNPKAKEILGLPVYPNVKALPLPVDLAIVFVAAPLVPAVIADCAKRGIRRVMIQSAGFAEAGKAGALIQDQCLSVASKHGIRLWGPNCMGVVNAHSGMVASFMRIEWEGYLKSGGVSLIVQSGMLSAGFLVQVLMDGYFGLSKACSIGNRCDVNECDLLEYFAQDPETAVVGLYLESIADVPRFRSAVSNLKRPVVLLKGGISEAGARAAKSHTASLAGNALLAEGFFRQLGVHRARDFLEMVDLIRAFELWQGLAGGKRVAVVTFSGASGILAADHLDQYGLRLANLSPPTVHRLKSFFPDWVKPQNPVDVWPAIERVGAEAFRLTLQALLQDREVDGIFLHLYVDARILPEIPHLLEPLQGVKIPVASWVIGDSRCFRKLRDHAEGMGVPVYGEISRGAHALSLMGNRDQAG